MPTAARYDGLAEWYEDFRPELSPDEVDALERLLGPGDGRCLDLGCGSGVSSAALAELGWNVVGVDLSGDLLERARARGVEVVLAPAEALPFADASFASAASIWTHTDMDDFPAALGEVARVLRPHAPFVYVGAHPCFIGPHSRFVGAKGVPVLHPGYRRRGRYADAPGIAPEGLRARVGATHLPLAPFLQAFLDAPLRVEIFEELPPREYPHMVALRCRR